MWVILPSLQSCVEYLVPVYTCPTFNTSCELLLAWAMCLGRHHLMRVGHSAHPQHTPDLSQRHGLDCYYNFFERSAWSPTALACRVAVLILTRLNLSGRITLLVDDTLAHKRGRCVWGSGWFRDAVASTKKRVATASGHNWVVLAIAVTVPGTTSVILALPLLARLHRTGKDQPSCPQLARLMLQQVLDWFPNRTFTLVGDNAYSCKELLMDLPEAVHFVGRIRADAAVYDRHPPKSPKGKRGPKAKKGERLPTPKQAAAEADRKRPQAGAWLWRAVEVVAYGSMRRLQTVSYEVVWPHVLGLRPIRVVAVRDEEGRMDDCYLFTTQTQATVGWVIEQFASRWSIEVLFRSSKQVLEVEAPQHWCEESVQKVAPWVWSMQSVLLVWYLTAGKDLPEAEQLRQRMGPWESEYSLRTVIRVLQQATLNATINPNSTNEAQLREYVQTLENWALLAA